MADQEQDRVRRPSHREGDAIVFDTPPDPKEAARQARENEQHEFARDQVKTNKKLAWFTGLLVVGTFIGSAIGIWQASISQTAATAAKHAAQIARDTLTATQKANDQQTRDNAATVIEAKRVSDANAAQSSKSFQATIDNFRQEQRAWVGLTPINTADVSYPATTTRAKITRTFIVNTGKTPATNVRVTGEFYQHPGDRPIDKDFGYWMGRIIDADERHGLDGVQLVLSKCPPDYDHCGPHKDTLVDSQLVPPGETGWVNQITHRMIGVLAPSIIYNFTYQGSFSSIDDMTIVVFGKVRYTDIYKIPRTTDFCVFTRNPNKIPYEACPVFNSMN